MEKRSAFRTASLLAALAVMMAVSVGALSAQSRIISVDVSNRIFEDPAGKAVEYERRLGAKTVEIYFNDDAKPSAVLEASKTDTGKASQGYTRLEVPRPATVKRITVKTTGSRLFSPDSGKKDGYAGAGNYQKEIKALNMFSNLVGYEGLDEVEKYKVYPNDSSSNPSNIGLGIQCCPIDMLAPNVSTTKTSLYRERKLQSGEIEVLPSWVENPKGMTFDVYLCESNYTKLSDIKSGTDKWTSAWKYDEVTMIGRSVGGTEYVMVKVNDEPLDALNPSGDGFRSYLVKGLDATNYYYIAVVAYFGNGSVVSSVKEIQVF